MASGSGCNIPSTVGKIKRMARNLSKIGDARQLLGLGGPSTPSHI